jgi:predicted HD phosphohydrolase
VDHVANKCACTHEHSPQRYLCATEQPYHDALSAGSKRSLELQGGPFTDEEAAEWASSSPHALDAVQLRRLDDRAKKPNTQTSKQFEDYVPLLRRVLLGSQK